MVSCILAGGGQRSQVLYEGVTKVVLGPAATSRSEIYNAAASNDTLTNPLTNSPTHPLTHYLTFSLPQWSVLCVIQYFCFCFLPLWTVK